MVEETTKQLERWVKHGMSSQVKSSHVCAVSTQQ